MNYETKVFKAEKYLENMSMDAFDAMLERCGINTIQPSVKSDFVKAVRKNFYDVKNLYVCKSSLYKSEGYEEFSLFPANGQEVA